MKRSDELRALLARVEEAGAGSRELSQRLFALGFGWSFPLHGAALAEFETIEREGLAEISSSVDAATALIEALLLGWSWEARGNRIARFAQACLWDPRTQPGCGLNFRVDHASGVPALALIAALLSALLAREEAGHGR